MGDIKPKVSDIGKQPWFIRYFIYIFLLCIFVSMVFIIGFLMPFKPFTFDKYAVVPPVVCAGERVQVSYVGSIEERWWYEVDNMEGTGYWITPSGIPFNIQPVDKPVSDNTQGILTSPIIRTAPLEEGEYKIGAEIAITGRMFYVVPVRQPKAANTIISSEQSVKVLPLRHEDCRKTLVPHEEGG